MSAVKIGLIVLVVIAFAAIAWVLSRRSQLPSHLKPYFKNSGALDSFVKEQRAADDRRRKELTDPANSQEAAEYLSLHGYDVANPTFEKALQTVETSLKDSPSEYGQLLGEIYTFSKAYRNPDKAYYYYYIGLSQDGYSVGFRDKNHDPPHYLGPVGDFGNEPQISELVDELGWDRIKQIDLKASEWLSQNNFRVQDFLDKEQDPTEPSTALE